MDTIYSKRDLIRAYESLQLAEQLMGQVKPENKQRADDYIISIKRKIRQFVHSEPDRVVIQSDEYGWVEKMMLDVSSKEEAEEYFEENEKRVYIPSQFDCTGQLFSSWHSIFKHKNGYVLYHRITADI